MNQRLHDIAKRQQGFIASGDATRANVPRRCLTDAVNKGELRQVDRGLYALPEVWDDEFVIAQHRFTRGVFSHETALFLHDMTDRTPEKLTMTFPHGYNTTAPRKAGILSKTVSSKLIELGKITLSTPFDNEVEAYDIERTLCDIVRGNSNPDPQLVNPAMKSYAASSSRNINRLLDYAEKLGVARKIRTYMEVLL